MEPCKSIRRNNIHFNYSLQFPELEGNVYGEENDTIQNNKGEDVTIQVGETVEETLQCLTKALGDDLDSAQSLAEAAHKEFEPKDRSMEIVMETITATEHSTDIMWLVNCEG